MQNKDDVTLEDVSDINESFAMFGGIAVIFGVVIELGVAFALNDEYKWWLFWANFLVAFGVSIEVICSRISRTASNELKNRSNVKIAEANRIASEANLKAKEEEEKLLILRKEVAWREITLDQKRIIIEGLSGREINVEINFDKSEEAALYALDMKNALEAAHCKVSMRAAYNGSDGGKYVGIQISRDFGGDDIEAEMVRKAFEEAGIKFATGEIAYRNSESPKSPVWIYIFTKPRPNLGL